FTPTATPTVVPCSPIAGSITAADPTQIGRMDRNGVVSACDFVKEYPGTFDVLARHYDAYTFANNSGATTCVTVTLSSSCAGANDIFAAAYLASFDPANLATNYLGDGGNSPHPSTTFSVIVPAGATFVVVVHEVTANAGCSN